MEVQGDYLFPGPKDLVWDVLLDPEVLATVLPGCEKLELVGEDEYEGALKIKVGPVQGSFVGKVKLEDIQRPDSYTMHVDGRGGPGFVKATGHLSLEPEDGGTRVTYEGSAQVGGRLASVGQRLVESSAKAIIKQSLNGLSQAVQSRTASAGGSAADNGSDAPSDGAGARASDPAQAPTPPSQAGFAANVAREMVRDLIPAPVLYGGIAVVLLVIVYAVYALVT